MSDLHRITSRLRSVRRRWPSPQRFAAAAAGVGDPTALLALGACEPHERPSTGCSPGAGDE